MERERPRLSTPVENVVMSLRDATATHFPHPVETEVIPFVPPFPHPPSPPRMNPSPSSAFEFECPF